MFHYCRFPLEGQTGIYDEARWFGIVLTATISIHYQLLYQGNWKHLWTRGTPWRSSENMVWESLDLGISGIADEQQQKPNREVMSPISPQHTFSPTADLGEGCSAVWICTGHCWRPCERWRRLRAELNIKEVTARSPRKVGNFLITDNHGCSWLKIGSSPAGGNANPFSHFYPNFSDFLPYQ